MARVLEELSRPPGTAYQNFINLVSVYSGQQGVVLATQQFEFASQ